MATRNEDGEEAKLVKRLLRGVEWRDRGKCVKREYGSARQEREIELWGVIGSIEISGATEPLLPLLAVGQFLHVGKSTSYGHGWYELQGGCFEWSESR